MVIGLAVITLTLISATTANNDGTFENFICPLSSRISTERDLVFAYDEAFFTDEELRQHPNRKRYLCPHEWIKVANVVFYPSRLHIFAAVRALCCYCCGGATPRAYKVMLLSTVGGLLVP